MVERKQYSGYDSAFCSCAMRYDKMCVIVEVFDKLSMLNGYVTCLYTEYSVHRWMSMLNGYLTCLYTE
jgi:hypothetical protein